MGETHPVPALRRPPRRDHPAEHALRRRGPLGEALSVVGTEQGAQQMGH